MSGLGQVAWRMVALKAGMIVDVEASPVSKTAEANATKKMIDRVEQKFSLKPARLGSELVVQKMIFCTKQPAASTNGA